MSEEPKKTEAQKAFKEGLTHYRNSYYGKALPKFQQAVELNRQNPLYVSYLGLLLALAQKKYADAEQLCHAALRMKRNEPQFYLNLAEVYVRARQKSDAVETLSVGLRYTKRDARLTRALRRLGVRREPPLPFLKRRSFLNRHLGRLRHRVLVLLGQE